MRNFLKTPLAGAFFDAPFSLLLLLAIFFIHPLMGIFSLFGAAITFLIGILIEKKVVPDVEKSQNSMAESRSLIDSYSRNIYSSMSMGTLPRLKKKWLIAHQSSYKPG